MLRNILFVLIFISQVSQAEDYTIYLTFDDGPLGGTENILQVLEEERVPATFFMVGVHLDRCKNCQNLMRKIKKSQYVFLGNHSYSHAFGHYTRFYKDAKAVVKDMNKNNRTFGLKKEHIVYSRLPGRKVFRLPGVSSDDPYVPDWKNNYEKNVSEKLFNEDFYIFGWDHEWEHNNGVPIQSVNKLIKEIEEKLESRTTTADDELILLMHDQMFRTPQASKRLRQLIIRLKQKGYKFASITDYTPALSNIEGFTNDIELGI